MQYDVTWCEDCEYFGHADMGGEGWCDTYDTATWYGKNAMDCPYFKEKEGGRVMTPERQKTINEWLSIHCQKCIENADRGTGYVNCQAECEVLKDVGIACIHYEQYHEQDGE